MTEAVLALDLGGTQMRAAVVGPDGCVRARHAQPTPHDAQHPGALFALATGVLALESAGHAVVALPGIVNYRDGCLEHAPNLPAHWAPHLNSNAFEAALEVPVELANDADAAAVGEAAFGAARGIADVVYLTVSTGVGAGVLLGGRLVAGDRSSAEVGHSVVDLRAYQEGRPATLEDLGSGTALGRAAAAAGLPADGAQVAELVRCGDPRARRVWDGVVDAVSVGVRNLVQLYSPEVVVIGGGLGRASELLIAVREAVRAEDRSGRATPVRVLGAALGDDAGLIGAAAWRRATRGRVSA
ncbi:MAG: ROK family protein [Mycobacteriales bacterium]